MCQICSQKPIYEFTNKQKLCKECFFRWFRKKFLYTIRKFKMIEKGDVIGYNKSKTFRDIVLENLLRFYETKAPIKIVELYSQACDIGNKKLINNKINSSEQTSSSSSFNKLIKQKILAEPNLKRVNLKIAVSNTTDSEANKIINTIIKNKLSKLKQSAPINKDIIKPLYLFLDKEVLLYAKLKKLKFKKQEIQKDKISKFIDELEKKHPEVKNAIVSSCLKIN